MGCGEITWIDHQEVANLMFDVRLRGLRMLPNPNYAINIQVKV
jgi:hypothetical protein